jgi:mitochondrial fission protein ELM1
MTTKSLDKYLLILNDGRIGNYKQLLAITDHLKTKFNINETKLQFNFWSKLPNILHVFDSISINNSEDLTKLKFSPDLILSCGRRSAPIAKFLKSKYKNAKLVHLLKPNINPKAFDMIITPVHDQYPAASFEYILPPTNVANINLANQSQGFEYLKLINEEKICVIIGGSSKNKSLSKNDFENFAIFMNFIAGIQNKKILLTTSRRTDPELIDIINSATSKNTNIEAYLYRDNDDKNPYGAFLYYADKVIVTGDSISMVADALMTKKPLIIYEGFAGKKHKTFLKTIFKNKYALKFSETISEHDFDTLTKYNQDDAKAIANAILELFY